MDSAEERASVGGSIRDEHAGTLGAQVSLLMCYVGNCHILVVELYGARQGILLAWEKKGHIER